MLSTAASNLSQLVMIDGLVGLSILFPLERSNLSNRSFGLENIASWLPLCSQRLQRRKESLCGL